MANKTLAKICLVQSNEGTSKYYFDFTIYRLFEHLGLEYLQSSLEKAGFESHIILGPAMEVSDTDITKQVLKIKPKLVGFTLESHSLSATMLIAKKIKQYLPDTHITVGGHLATSVPEELLNDFDCIDSVSVGYGDDTIVRIAEAVSKAGYLNSIPGIVFRGDNKLVRTLQDQSGVNINDISFPSRDILEWRKKQGYPSASRMITSRGCPFNCNMCTTPVFLRSQKCPKWIGRSAQNVLEEITELVENHGIRTIVFCDDNFMGGGKEGRQRAQEIAQLLIDSKINVHFWIMCRVDSFLHDGMNLIEQLQRAGLCAMFLGVESGSKSQLRIFGKPMNVEKARFFIKSLHRLNILVELGFIMFYPYSTFKELRENANFLHDISESSIFRYFANSLILYPGIAIIDDLRKNNLLIEDYRYDSILGYKYLDPRIKVLAIALDKIANDFDEMDEVVWNMKRLHSLIATTLNDGKQNPRTYALLSNLEGAKQCISSGLTNICNVNYDKFFEYLEIACEENPGKVYYSLSKEHKKLIKSQIKKMVSSIKKLRNIPKDRLSVLRDGDLLQLFIDFYLDQLLMSYG